MRSTPLGETQSQADIKQISIPRVPGGRVLWDSNTIASAAEEAGIKTVQFCDRHQFSVLGGLWAQDAIVVYGNP